MPLSAKAIAYGRDCYQRLKAQNLGCSGCHLDGVCGRGRDNAYFLAELLKVIDPDGSNVAVFRLGPIGEKDD